MQNIYTNILRASPPAAGPSKVTGARDLWFCVRFCCIGIAWNSFRRYFLRAWRCFEELCGTFGSPGGLHGVPSSIFRDLGCNFRGLETSVFDTNRTLDSVLLICSLNVIIGINFSGFIVFQGTPRTWKTMKIVVLSFKNEDRQNDIRNQIQRSPGSIFHEFVVVLGALAVILDLLGYSVLDVDFQLILKRSQQTDTSGSGC